MRKESGFVFVILMLVLAAAPAIADSHEGGNIARVTYWTVDAANADAFEAGIKAHNQLHAKHNDPHPIFTGIIVSGHDQGVYIRGSLGHKWADFDGAGAVPSDEDDADMAIHVQPYIEAARTVYYEHDPEISNPAAGPAPMASATFFYIKPGQGRNFRSAVAKIHAAIGDDWVPYNWYSVADGGKQPTWVLVAPRDSWAALDEDRDEQFVAAMTAAHGENWREILDALYATVSSQYGHSMVFPAELSYTPAAE